jgi:hypothetical protein
MLYICNVSATRARGARATERARARERARLQASRRN